MNGLQKLNEIISSTKSFGDKHGIRYDEGVSSSVMVAHKFARSTAQEPNLKSVIVTPKR